MAADNTGDGNTHPERLARDPRNGPQQPTVVAAGAPVAKGQAIGGPNGGYWIALRDMPAGSKPPSSLNSNDVDWRFSLGPS